ncbi:hypothetical protein [Actinobaculum sp. 313]|uniref:hypothetical protein n=1 Tax=Actinobaculum sp. 313 TaxID=2495645 RepID=UPI000D52985F|nr:hypothetical protein [Actinobaculum sp. 313]AWE42262.1 hypothetical protein DDD63_05325 [Actinobaculum sp. 313]
MNPDLTLSPDRSAVCTHVWEARSLSIAQRLLAGAGKATLVAYHVDPIVTISSLAHGLGADGSVYIAATAADDASLTDLCSDEPMDVRLSIEKQAPDPSVQITACAVHALATAQWLERDEILDLLYSSFLPSRVAEIATAPQARTARLEGTRVLLHDAGGVTPVSLAAIADIHRQRCQKPPCPGALFNSPYGELTALERISALNCTIPTLLFQAMRRREISGALMSRQPVHINVEMSAPAVLCLDIDRTGLTLMRIDDDEALTGFVPFPQQVETSVELAEALAAL